VNQFTCDVGTPAGQVALSRLPQGSAAGTSDATPLGALVNYVKDCKSADEVTWKCAALLAGH
jgi:hypothetical protein